MGLAGPEVIGEHLPTVSIFVCGLRIEDRRRWIKDWNSINQAISISVEIVCRLIDGISYKEHGGEGSIFEILCETSSYAKVTLRERRLVRNF